MESAKWQQIKEIFNAAIDLPENERPAFLEKHDKNILREVQKLIKANENANNFIVEPAFVEVGLANDNETDLYVGKQIDNYKILEEIGQGGMGTVYLAVKADESFDKKVAIKLIKRGMDTTAVLKRFVMERKILAQLENPNIASLLDGGSTADGLPYLVMEYIEGLAVTKFCDLHKFSAEQRLELFRKVCSAISYAHQNLVVHRDIKPSNILVTQDGTPKLLDFGIAKLLNPDWSLEPAEATATMFRLMTPEYASPEQVRGLPITTASDVYSLGVVLYELLSGERPYKIESRLPHEVAQVVLTEEPIRPSSVVSFKSQVASSKLEAETSKLEAETLAYDGRQTVSETPNPKSKIQNLKSLRGDLDNIILKALRKEPERRYQSVQEFSEDIRRHLVGLPVTATADTLFYRIGKFVKRHRVGVVVSILMLLTILLATTITTWQAIVAKREQAKTQKRFNQVRKLANTVLFEYHDGIAKLPGSTPIREKMVKAALEYLDNLSAESIDDKDLQLELAVAYEKVGDVQGNPYLANLGDQEGALASYRKCLEIREAIYLTNSSDVLTKSDLGSGYNSVGDILWAKSEKQEALSNYRKGLAIYEELSTAKPEVVNYKQSMLVSINGIAHVQTQMSDFTGALETYRKMLEVSETVLATDPRNELFRHTVAIGNLKVADALSVTADFKDAPEYYQKAIEMLSAIGLADKNNARAWRDLSLAFGNAAGFSTDQKQYQNAIEFNRKALEIQKQVAVADPTNNQIKFDMAETLHNIGYDFMMFGKFETAAANLQESIKIFKEASAKNPDYTQSQVMFGNAYLNYAEVLHRQNNEKGAMENYQNALTILEPELVRSETPDALANTYQGIGAIHQKANRFQDAKIWYQKSLDVWNDLRENGKLASEYSTKPDEITKLIKNCETKLK